MNIILHILTLLGSIGLFLFGMTLMSESLQKVAGAKLRSTLASMTSNSLKRVLTGSIITSVIQSSTATTVMVVSFVNAGLLPLAQAVGVIMGANIGTTVTAWGITLLGFEADISAISLPLIGIGFILKMFKSGKKRDIGNMIIGFAMIFLGLEFLKDIVPELSPDSPILGFFRSCTGHGFFSVLFFILVGTLFTIVFQSSSAMMAVTMVMANQGWLPFDMAAAMVLGENLGTTITANIAAAVGNISARRAALAHTIFNLFGIIWALILYKPFLWVVSYIVHLIGGGDPNSDPQSLLYAISTLHTLFNIINTLILIWFTDYIVKLVCIIIKGKKESDDESRLKYISSGIINTPELAIEQAEKEILHFSDIVSKQLGYVREAVNKCDDTSAFDDYYRKVEHYEQITDRVEFEIAKYLGHLRGGDLSPDSSGRVQAMYRIIGEIESIGDSGYNIVRILKRKNMHNRHFDAGMTGNINRMLDLVGKAMEIMRSNLEKDYGSVKEISGAQEAEKSINTFRDQLKELHIRSIEEGEEDYLQGVYYTDIIYECEKIGDYIINVSEAIIENIR